MHFGWLRGLKLSISENYVIVLFSTALLPYNPKLGFHVFANSMNIHLLLQSRIHEFLSLCHLPLQIFHQRCLCTPTPTIVLKSIISLHLCHHQHKSRGKVFLSPKRLSHVPLLAASSQATTDMLSASEGHFACSRISWSRIITNAFFHVWCL